MENSASYFKENLPRLIDELKKSLEVLYPIISQKIDEDIKDDRTLNVLKAKRQASEDVEWTLKKIDEYEKILLGKDDETEKIPESALKSRVRTTK